MKSLNLHRIAQRAIAGVNPPETGVWRRSAGYTTADDGEQVPLYDEVPNTPMQVQALSAGEVMHLDSMNIGGVMRGFWLDGDVQSVNRVAGQGGDLLIVSTGTYLVVHVFETWSAGGWCHVAGVLQGD